MRSGAVVEPVVLLGGGETHADEWVAGSMRRRAGCATRPALPSRSAPTAAPRVPCALRARHVAAPGMALRPGLLDGLRQPGPIRYVRSDRRALCVRSANCLAAFGRWQEGVWPSRSPDPSADGCMLQHFEMLRQEHADCGELLLCCAAVDHVALFPKLRRGQPPALERAMLGELGFVLGGQLVRGERHLRSQHEGTPDSRLPIARGCTWVGARGALRPLDPADADPAVVVAPSPTVRSLTARRSTSSVIPDSASVNTLSLVDCSVVAPPAAPTLTGRRVPARGPVAAPPDIASS